MEDRGGGPRRESGTSSTGEGEIRGELSMDFREVVKLKGNHTE